MVKIFWAWVCDYLVVQLGKSLLDTGQLCIATFMHLDAWLCDKYYTQICCFVKFDLRLHLKKFFQTHISTRNLTVITNVTLL